MHMLSRSSTAAAAATAVVVALLAGPALGADAAHKPAPKPAAKTARKPVVVEAPIADASPDQVKAAEMVYYGIYDCEFKQTVNITQSPKHSAYVDVAEGKAVWLMKPVLSSTGAIRLEDVRGETLMVQIASKSMLLNVKTGHRIVDDCVSPKQRELIDAARAAKEEATRSASAASAAS